jgi:hypothetical protein
MRLVKQEKQTRGIIIAHPRDRVKARARETKGEIWTRQGHSGRLSWRPTPERHSQSLPNCIPAFVHPSIRSTPSLIDIHRRLAAHRFTLFSYLT